MSQEDSNGFTVITDIVMLLLTATVNAQGKQSNVPITGEGVKARLKWALSGELRYPTYS